METAQRNPWLPPELLLKIITIRVQANSQYPSIFTQADTANLGLTCHSFLANVIHILKRQLESLEKESDSLTEKHAEEVAEERDAHRRSHLNAAYRKYICCNMYCISAVRRIKPKAIASSRNMQIGIHKELRRHSAKLQRVIQVKVRLERLEKKLQPSSNHKSEDNTTYFSDKWDSSDAEEDNFLWKGLSRRVKRYAIS